MEAELKGARVALQRTRQMLVQAETATTAPISNAHRYAAIFDHALDAILIADDAGRYIDVNDAACTLLGYTREELLQLAVVDITPDAERHLVPQLWAEFVEQGSMSGEYAVRTKSGGLTHVEFRAVANVVWGEHVSILRDVTKLRVLQQEKAGAVSAEHRAVVAQLYGALDALVAAKLDLQSSGWRMAVGRNSRRVGADIDAITASLRQAITSFEAVSGGALR